MLRILALAPLMAVLALGNAYAGGEKKEDGEKKPPPKKGKFDPKAIWEKLDANDDGKISKEEYLKGKDKDELERWEKRFAEFDDNNDGFISQAEWKKGWDEMKAKFGKKKPKDDDDKEKKDKD